MTERAEVFVEMYLAPEATGVYDWHPIDTSTSNTTILRESDVVVSRGNEDLNEEPSPGWATFSAHDPDGNLNEDNPMGIYYGSIRRGTHTRIGVSRVDSQFSTPVSNSWGSVGNTAGDVWTNGTSSGGTVSASDWSVSGGAARHSVPADGAYRVSELTKTTLMYLDVEAHDQFTVPTSNVTGTGALATEYWFRAEDVLNFVAVSVAWMPDETVRIAFYDRTAGTNRYLMNYTTVPDLNLGTTGVDYDIRCQVEGESLRAKIWPTGDPEPLDWSAYASGVVSREGYFAVADYVFSGNTNAKPLVFQHHRVRTRLLALTGEVTRLVPEGEGEGKGSPKITHVRVADKLDQLSTPGAGAVKSVMRRGRTSSRRWIAMGQRTATGGDTRTVVHPTSTWGTVAVGDFFFLFNNLGNKKEDTQFTITSIVTAGSDYQVSFSPDARDSVISGDVLAVYRPKGPTTAPVVYWPMEDGDRATQVLSGLVGGSAMSISGSPDFAADTGYPCSAPLMHMGDAELVGIVPEYDDTNQAFTITFCLTMPASDEAATGTDLLQFYTNGTAWSWDLQYTANGNGSLKLLVHNAAFTQLYSSGDIDFGLRGIRAEVTLILRQNGGNVQYNLFTHELDGTGGGVGPTNVTGVSTLGKVTMMRANPAGGYRSVTMGHLTGVPDIWESDATFPDFLGWTNQATLHRLYRLCWEEGIPFYSRTSWDVITTNLGPQKTETLLTLLSQGPVSDGGFLYGPKGAFALEYCSRGALLNQTPVVTIDTAAGHILPPFNPIRDYSRVRNRVTVSRIDGSSTTVDMEEGRLSVLAPPEGIGVRDKPFTLSLGSDVQTINQANYRLGVGTVDSNRVSELRLTSAATNSISLERLMSLDIGRRIDVTGLESKDIYRPISLLITGYTLRLGTPEMPTISLNCAPYEPFRVLALTGDEFGMLTQTDTETGSTLTTSQTGSLTLVTPSGRSLWTTDAADFPQNIFIGGEEITIDSVTGDTSPQTANIIARGVNAVTKAHPVGRSVTAQYQNRWAFRQ